MLLLQLLPGICQESIKLCQLLRREGILAKFCLLCQLQKPIIRLPVQTLA